MQVVGIESSCDETAASVVKDGRAVLSNVVATQHELHAPFAGVVPEIASRAHLERILPVIHNALEDAHTTPDQLSAIAVGHRPGLIGSLLVGVSAAKALAWSLNIPIIGVDHVLAHLQAPALNADELEYPALGLVVSGGHTSFYVMHGPLEVTRIGRTIDDAIGEAYDKAATILHLGYPGGPKLDALAQHGNDKAHDLPVANLGRHDDGSRKLDVSFSGLKTALLYKVCGLPQGRGKNVTYLRDGSQLTDDQRADYAASFQRAAVRAIIRNLERALDVHNDVRTIIVGGGVSANSRLRTDLATLSSNRDVAVRLAPMEFCIDNAAMIASLGALQFQQGMYDDLSLAPSTSSVAGVNV